MEERIIFRNPNVTGMDMAVGLAYTMQAKALMAEALRLVESGEDDWKAAALVIKAHDLTELAAKSCGFRSAKDMNDYITIYGTL